MSDLATCECGNQYNQFVAPIGHDCPECWVEANL